MAPLNRRLVRDAKTIALLAFRNGPLEDLHAGKTCPVCGSDPEYSRINDQEMRLLMIFAVNKIYRLLWQRENDTERYRSQQAFAETYTRHWDDPDPEI